VAAPSGHGPLGRLRPRPAPRPPGRPGRPHGGRPRRGRAPDPYFDPVYDCFWFNPHPDWGEEGVAADDPRLSRDDNDGAGPESIELERPEAGQRYEVAVHVWDDHAYGASRARVRVWVRQALAFEIADVRLIHRDLWSVAWIDWPTGVVRPREAPGGGLWILPAYRPVLRFGN
jgi:hypothetical protein